MAKDWANRELSVGNRVVVSNTVCHRYGRRDGQTYGDITDIDGDLVRIDDEFWVNAKDVDKKSF